MIVFLALVGLLTILFAGLLIIVKKKVVSLYRGGIFILLSFFYFSAVFAIAHLLRERFQ